MTKERKYMFGPWGCVDTSTHAHDYRLTQPDGAELPVYAPGGYHSEQRAIARLLAAAPELLAAVEAYITAKNEAVAVADWHASVGAIPPDVVMRTNQLFEAAYALDVSAVAKAIGEG